MSEALELCVDARTTLGEGPIWDSEEQVLYWLDIMGERLFRYDPASGENRSYHVGQLVGAVVPRRGSGVMLAVQQGFAAFDLDSETLTTIADPEGDRPENRFNDGKCDPAGRFWAGTMALSGEEGLGSLYCLDRDWSVRKVLGNLTISNGIVWSLDQRTMYHIDTGPNTVTAYEYDVERGEIGDGRVVIRVPGEMGYPDGMAIDAEGMLWIAQYAGSRVCRWDPERAEVLQTIHLPVSKVTACAFGGAELDTLFITTATENMSEEEREQEPQAGGLFSVKPGVRGVPAFRFAG